MHKYAIAGLGVTPQGVIPGTSAEKLAWDAVELALSDSGLKRSQVNGYIYQPGFGERTSGMAASRASLGTNSTLQVDSSGATGIFTLIAAIGMIEAGTAEYVVCIHATNARSQSVTVGAGEKNQYAVFGLFSPGAQAAMMAQGYFHKYNRSSADLAEVAVALRSNAVPRSDAYMFNRPITVDDHQNSPFIVRPLHLLDYCLVTDGAIAFIVTTAERARDLKTKPVGILGLGTTHEVGQGYTRGSNTILGPVELEVEPARSRAFGTAGLCIEDIDVFEFYDAFTIMLALQVEAYGLCGRGEAGDWVRAGNVRWNSKRPCNTSGTLHSWAYVQGFTHLAEGIRQLRGEGGATQVPRARTAFVTNVGITGAGLAQSAVILGTE
ncbi:MAG: thiolase family protein [Deltaproteobacteria bacterium]|nr:thiolase family protein [Deltaproteobacteria bacterium]